MDADIVPLTEDEVARMYDAYRTNGGFPTDDVDQLAAVRQVVQANHTCLYADVSV